MFFFVVLFAVINAACNSDPNVDVATLTTASTCFGTQIANVISNPTAIAKATAVCSCIANYASTSSQNCDITAVGSTTLCSAATILNGISNSTYDFGTSCDTCANPPTSPNWPAPCLKCLSQYTACATTGYFNLRAYPSIATSISLKQVCGCISEFYNCFTACGSPVSSYIGQYACNGYSFCGCDGSGTVKNAAAAVAYLKQTSFLTFQNNIKTASGGAILSIECSLKTATTNGLASDRFVCEINFAAQANFVQLRTWLNNYLGRNSSVAVGIVLTGSIESVKRAETEELVTGTYTIVVDSSNSAFGLSATFSTFLVLAAMLVLLF